VVTGVDVVTGVEVGVDDGVVTVVAVGVDMVTGVDVGVEVGVVTGVVGVGGGGGVVTGVAGGVEGAFDFFVASVNPAGLV